MTSNGPSYRFESADDYSIVSLLPGINESRWGDIENVGNEILAKINSSGQPAVMIDLSALQYMGSAVVALILRIWKTAREKEGQMVIVTHEEIVYEVLRIAGLTEIWNVAETRAEAIHMLREGIFTKEANGSSFFLSFLGILTVVGAAVGLFFLLNPNEQIPPQITRIMGFGFSALGMITGTISAVRDRGIRRTIGVFVILVCLAISLAGLFIAQ